MYNLGTLTTTTSVSTSLSLPQNKKKKEGEAGMTGLLDIRDLGAQLGSDSIFDERVSSFDSLYLIPLPPED